MRVVFVIPSFNVSKNIDNLVSSIVDQDDDRWSAIIVDDMSTDNTRDHLESIDNKKIKIVTNLEKKYALKNIVEASREFEKDDETVIAVIDGDDQLCNPKTVGLLLNEYENGAEVVWTAHKWDVNGMNISKKLPEDQDPYQSAWCSSHLRTFKSRLLKEISDSNFKDLDGNWFVRGYDQALMLPLLKISKKNIYIPDVCYLYNIDSCSIPSSERDWSEKRQISTVSLVRARGFIPREK